MEDFVLLLPGLGFHHGSGAGARGNDGEQLRPDVDKPAEQHLFPLQFRSVDRHGVEQAPREPPARSGGVAKVFRQPGVNVGRNS